MKAVCNAHTHLELSDLGRVCPETPVRFDRWMSRLVLNLWRRSPAHYRKAVTQGIDELKACGTTHVHDITNTWLGVEEVLSSGLKGCVYLEIMGHDRDRALTRLKLACEKIMRFRQQREDAPMQVGLSVHSTWSCHPDLLKEAGAWCQKNHVPLCIHVAESPAETELLLTGRIRDLAWWRKRVARALTMLPRDFPGLRPIPYLQALGVLDARPLLVHAVQVNEEEIALISRSGCTVVHCPRSNALLSCGTMPLATFLEAGVPVHLGTDSRASSPDLDVRAEASFARTLHAGKVEEAHIDAMLVPPKENPW